jgi:hypothetical protein
LTAADEYRQRGFLRQARPLADATVLPALLADEPVFAQALESMRTENRHGVPYLLTEAIRRATQDAAILAVVEAILGTREWVMWGANIRRATPNQAHTWHVDLESLLWPTVTVAIGMEGCTPESATWCIPGTHRSGKGPDAETAAHGSAEQIAGFGDGHFYVFDARVWHRGDPETSRERVVLFVHYHRADEPRIPLMVDYERLLWANEPCPYFSNAAPDRVCTGLAALPWRHQLHRWANRVLGR